jgi:hypothetical protein
LRNGASVTDVPGRGRVLDLNGASAHVELPVPVANARTFAAWVNWAGGGAWQRIFDFGDGTGRYLFLTPRAHNGNLRFAITINGNGAENVIDAPFALPTNTWAHVAVTLDGARGFLYLNGYPVATNNSITLGPWQVLARSNFVGRSQWPDPFFTGRIDSFRVFGRALTHAEVRDIAYAHPGLAHRYSFVLGPADSIGMSHGVLMGNAAVTNRALKLTGAPGGYLNLPGGLVSGASAVTLEFWASFGANGNWARVFDFGNLSGSNGDRSLFFSPRTSFAGQRLGLFTAEGGSNLDLPGILDGKTLHVACIVDPGTGYSAIFTNGVLCASQAAPLPALGGVGDAWSFIGRSLFAADAWLNATIDEFRIYDGRLTPEEIATSYISGPDELALTARLTTARVTNSSVVLSWPAYALGFVPEMSSTLAGPWATVPATPVLADDRWFVTVPSAESAKFFRLRR